MKLTPLKMIDIPPVWLVAALVATYWLAQVQPSALSIAHPITRILGAVLVGAGLCLMFAAFIEMRRHKTTVIPHLEAAHLVRTGIFARSRNPIYLGDVLVLFGLIFRWDALIALPLVPVLAWVLKTRFILAEESRLRRKFGAEFDSYTQATGRWFSR